MARVAFCSLIEVGLLLVAGGLMLWRPRGSAIWIGPVTCVVVGLATTLLSPSAAASSLSPLRDSLLFLAFAVPLAVGLDEMGVFAAIATRFGHDAHLVARLWWLAAGVVAVFNLDAAVVLLTPLYVRIARRHGLPVEALAFQPVLLACLNSGVLPVSNLTNLIVADRWDLTAVDFLTHLALPSVAASAIGYVAYRRVFRFDPTGVEVQQQVDPRALRRGAPIIVFVLAGFTLGDALGVPAWAIAAVAWSWTVSSTRRSQWRAVPLAAVVTAASLAVLVTAALPALGLDRIFGRSGVWGDLGIVAFGTIGSSAANNLPIVLAGSSAMTNPDQAWPLLVGTNIGAIFVISASLSGLLWSDTAARAGVHVSPRRYLSVSARVGVPASIVATLLVLLT